MYVLAGSKIHFGNAGWCWAETICQKSSSIKTLPDPGSMTCDKCVLSHTIQAETGGADMHAFCMAALKFLTGHRIKERTPVQKLRISQLCASLEPGKHSACGLMLPRP